MTFSVISGSLLLTSDAVAFLSLARLAFIFLDLDVDLVRKKRKWKEYNIIIEFMKGDVISDNEYKRNRHKRVRTNN